MQIRVAIIVMFTFLSISTTAQEYHVSTTRTDSFSLALVHLLQCATSHFRECTGDSIRTTWLMGTDHQLAFPFPGSIAAIIRKRDWDVNAYIEFRGYKNVQEREKGIRDIVSKIKLALGEQLHDRNTANNGTILYFYGLALKDRNGYFNMNMELFGSSSAAPIYLLGPEKEPESDSKRHFVLLKIYPGVPRYQHYIRSIPPPDPKLHHTIQQIVKWAAGDFDSLRNRKRDSLINPNKNRETIQLNGEDVHMHYRGNYSATLSFPQKTADKITFAERWTYYQRILQAALGSDYVYAIYGLNGKPYVVYYPMVNGGKRPGIYLEKDQDSMSGTISIKISSTVSHPTKAGLDLDDF